MIPLMTLNEAIEIRKQMLEDIDGQIKSVAYDSVIRHAEDVYVVRDAIKERITASPELDTLKICILYKPSVNNDHIVRLGPERVSDKMKEFLKFYYQEAFPDFTVEKATDHNFVFYLCINFR